jgi:hypothetical protein
MASPIIELTDHVMLGHEHLRAVNRGTAIRPLGSPYSRRLNG